MSDDEDFDEFPSICVNSSLHESSGFSMPRADELASERARAAATERQLLRLRDEHALSASPAPAATATALAQGVSLLTHSDSSGSEGEAALAAAVDALRVRAAPGVGAGSGAGGAGLLAALAARLPRPAPFLQAYADALAATPPHARPRLMHEVLQAAAEMVAEAGTGALADDEALGIAAWLCALAAAPAAHARSARRLLLRTLHLLIDDVATDEQVEAVWGALEVSCGDAAVALELSDALRGGGVRGERLARRLAAGALAALAGGEGSACGLQSSLKEATGALAGAWRRLPAARRYLALQLLARAEGEEGAVAAALEALAQAPPGHRTQSTDELKVLVATTKLQVLFHVKR